MAQVQDTWKDTWDWAESVWGVVPGDYSFNDFFRGLAQKRAVSEGWEELGSSDVWHASFDAVQSIRTRGTVATRAQLREAVLGYLGY